MEIGNKKIYQWTNIFLCIFFFVLSLVLFWGITFNNKIHYGSAYTLAGLSFMFLMNAWSVGLKN